MLLHLFLLCGVDLFYFIRKIYLRNFWKQVNREKKKKRDTYLIGQRPSDRRPASPRPGRPSDTAQLGRVQQSRGPIQLASSIAAAQVTVTECYPLSWVADGRDPLSVSSSIFNSWPSRSLAPYPPYLTRITRDSNQIEESLLYIS
jgi:hypothetical protein